LLSGICCDIKIEDIDWILLKKIKIGIFHFLRLLIPGHKPKQRIPDKKILVYLMTTSDQK